MKIYAFQNLRFSKCSREATNPVNDPNHSAKHNFWFQTFQKFYFCCRQKFLAQKCVIFVWLKVKMCRNGSFCVEISAGNKIKIFESIIARRIFCIITMRFYLSKPAISSWSKFWAQKRVFFNVTEWGGNFWKVFMCEIWKFATFFQNTFLCVFEKITLKV